MKKILSLFAISLLICLIGCKLDAPVFPNVTPKSDSYQPVTKGSYWKYYTNATVNHPVINATVTMTGETETIGGFLCYKYNYATDEGSRPGYYYHGNDIYLSISNSPPSVYDLDPYLKDNFQIGKTWETPLYGNNISVGRIVEKDIKRTVNGKSFTDVIHTQLLSQYPEAGVTFKTFQTTDYYIAKGVGLIEVNNTTPDGPEITLLKEYSIK